MSFGFLLLRMIGHRSEHEEQVDSVTAKIYIYIFFLVDVDLDGHVHPGSKILNVKENKCEKNPFKMESVSV